MASLSLSGSRDGVINAAKLDLLDREPAADITRDKERKSLERNFCSDTVTAPSPEMLAYAMKAVSLGDDVFGWDYCTNRLEEHVAKLCGKEAAIFVSSGTMGNQIAVKCLLDKPPFSVLSDYRAHIYTSEAGGLATNTGAASIPVVPSNGKYLSLEDVKTHAILSDDIHYATTRVIALENTIWGVIHPQESILEISKFARENGLKMHLDGARLWHVSVETGNSLKELCEPFDTISLCFSKGLGCPVGSIIVGPADTISLARRYRKLFGGAMRQIGMLAACASYALSHHIALLPNVHQKARKLAERIQDLGITITQPVDTCMVWFDPSPVGLKCEDIAERAQKLDKPIAMFPADRLVVHIQTSDEAIDDMVELLRKMAKEAKGGKLPSSNNTANRAPYPAKL
ncbi:hypothetical protein CPB86DRAFT_816527 [Serendipita vermifera]|nr:hypothetical protein CPB86DRAFT_816527 [Serendipita vermifera]